MNISAITDRLKQYPIAVISVALLLVFVGVIFLRGGIASELSVKDSDLNARIKTIEENIKNSNNIEQDLEDLNALVSKINSSLFDRYERSINISFFYELEDKADVVITNISQLAQPDPIYAEGGVRKLDLHSTLVFNINLTGSFQSILKFLHEIERVDPLMRVADFQVSRSSEVGGQSVDARLRILVMAENN